MYIKQIAKPAELHTNHNYWTAMVNTIAKSLDFETFGMAMKAAVSTNPMFLHSLWD